MLDTKLTSTRYVSADWEQLTFNIGQTLFPKDPQINLVPIYHAATTPNPNTTLSASAIAGIVWVFERTDYVRMELWLSMISVQAALDTFLVMILSVVILGRKTVKGKDFLKIRMSRRQ